MTRGTLWAGRAADGEFEIEAAAGVTKFKSTELKSIRRAAMPLRSPAPGSCFDVEVAGGLKLRGRFVSHALRWQRDNQILELPWAQVLEVGTEAKK